MERMLGCAMVMLSAVMFSLLRLFRLKKRRETVKQLARAMLYISSCINFSQLKLAEIFSQLSQREPALKEMFVYFADGLAKKRNCAELWKESLEKTPLSAEDISIFLPLGGSFGMTDKSAQIKTIEMIMRDAAVHEEKLAAAADRYKAVDMKVTIMAGIMAVIVLI